MKNFVESHLIQHLESEAMKLFLGPRMEDVVYIIQLLDFRDLLLVNGLTTLDQLSELSLLGTSAIAEYTRVHDPLIREGLFDSMTLAEKYVILEDFLS